MKKMLFLAAIAAALGLAACQPSSEPTKPVEALEGLYTAQLPSASSAGRSFFLTLTGDGSAYLSIDYQNDKPALIQTGTWTVADNQRVTLELVTKNREAVEETLVFDLKGDTLTLVDNSDYGSEGLALTRVSEESLVLAPAAWMWIETLDSSGKKIRPENPSSYSAQFEEDGRVGLQLDCNVGSGSFTVDGDKVDITPGLTTLMACPQPTWAMEFTQHLDSAAIYFFQDGQLFLDMKADAGTMRLVKIK